MTPNFTIRVALTIAGALLSGRAALADKPSWCANGVLLETRSYSDPSEASGFANSQSGSATINGVAHIVLGTVNVALAPAGNRVYVVQIWDCPKPPENGNGNGNGNAGNGQNPRQPEKVTYTLDPHPELDRNGKPRK